MRVTSWKPWWTIGNTIGVKGERTIRLAVPHFNRLIGASSWDTFPSGNVCSYHFKFQNKILCIRTSRIKWLHIKQAFLLYIGIRSAADHEYIKLNPRASTHHMPEELWKGQYKKSKWNWLFSRIFWTTKINP